MFLPSLKQILELHRASIDTFGGSYGILHKNQSASFIPQLHQAIFFEKFRKIEVAAWLLTRLVQNHYFVDGNKRVGLGTMLVFLQTNGCNWNLPETDYFFKLSMDIAGHQGNDILESVVARLSEVISCI